MSDWKLGDVAIFISEDVVLPCVGYVTDISDPDYLVIETEKGEEFGWYREYFYSPRYLQFLIHRDERYSNG